VALRSSRIARATPKATFVPGHARAALRPAITGKHAGGAIERAVASTADRDAVVMRPGVDADRSDYLPAVGVSVLARA
jgi:hypothetical protein